MKKEKRVKKEEKTDTTKNKKVKSKKTKTKMKLWEKLFILFSLSIIFIIMGIYVRRAVYYYKQSNYIAPDSKLVDVITNQMHIVYSGEGLYKNEENGTYYFSGKNVNNYLLYSGRLWRIIGVDTNGIKIITESLESSLVWGNKTNYQESNIYKWLNTDRFLNSISDNENLASANWCNQGIELNAYSCEEMTEAKVGLLTTEEYLRAGGVDSYINNNTYFWTLNTSSDNKAYYIHSEGGINNDVGSDISLYSYGVRPVIYLKSDISYEKGEGTIDNPYILGDSTRVAIDEHPVGTYLTYQGFNWRILEINEEYTKIILDGYLLNDENEPLKLTYNEALSYLNDTFINKLNKDDLVKVSFNETEYNANKSYDYNSIRNKTENYIGLPVVGDLFTTDYSSNWLNTYSNVNQKLVYTTSEDSSIFADLTSSENYVRPIVSIKNGLIIASGKGTKNEPYVMGEIQ